MDFRKGSKGTVLLQLQKYASLTITDPTMWNFSPVVIDNPADQSAARVKLSPSAKNTTYKGSRTFSFKRLDLQTVGISCKVIRFNVTPGDKAHDHFPRLQAQLGIQFDATDIENTDLVATATPNVYTLTLAAKPGSLAWYGTTTIRVEPFQHISLYVNVDSFTWNQTT
jgi:hypothetical protein